MALAGSQYRPRAGLVRTGWRTGKLAEANRSVFWTFAVFSLHKHGGFLSQPRFPPNTPVSTCLQLTHNPPSVQWSSPLRMGERSQVQNNVLLSLVSISMEKLEHLPLVIFCCVHWFEIKIQEFYRHHELWLAKKACCKSEQGSHY